MKPPTTDEAIDAMIKAANEIGADLVLIHAAFIGGMVAIERALVQTTGDSLDKIEGYCDKAIATARSIAKLQAAMPNN